MALYVLSVDKGFAEQGKHAALASQARKNWNAVYRRACGESLSKSLIILKNNKPKGFILKDQHTARRGVTCSHILSVWKHLRAQSAAFMGLGQNTFV
jgi:hypothetical protein